MKTVNLSDFDGVPSVKEQVAASISIDTLPSIAQVKALATWKPDVLKLVDSSREEITDRSAALSRIAYFGAELGWSDEQIVSVLMDADDRWEKYTGRRDRFSRLLDFVNRARQKYGYQSASEFTLGGLMPKKGPADSPVETELPTVYGYEDFLNADFHIDWMLEGLFAVGGLGLVTGYPGVGKTQFCLQIAHHLALGYDKFLQWNNADGPKKVMFLSLEMGANPLHLFMSTIAPTYEDRQSLQRNFMVVPLGSPIPLDTKEGQAFLNNLLDEYMPDVLFIDSLQKILSTELSDEQAVKQLVHYLSTARQKYKTSICLIHHNRKKSNDAQKKDVELSDVYGSIYITTDADFVLSLRLTNPQRVSVDMLKNRLGPTIDAFDIIRDERLTFSLEFDDIQARFGGTEREHLTL